MYSVSQRLLVFLASSRKAKGRVRLIAEGEGKRLEWAFSSAGALAGKLPEHNEAVLLIAGASPESAAATAVQDLWQGSPRGVWHCADLAYLWSLEAPENLDDLERLSEEAERCLASVSDDLLAQLAGLVSEAGAQQRLGFFEHELHRRHDALNMPASGEVDIEAYYPPSREAGAPSRQEMPSDMLERVFNAREAMARAFDEYEERPQQLDMARAVEQALAKSQPLIVEAGTGVGKSLAYLLPLAIHSARTGKLCLVSSNTINLQQQLVDLDVPRLRAILDSLELKITLLKGREHYLCLKRLEETWLVNTPGARQRRERFLGADVSPLLFILRLLLQCSEDNSGDLDTVPGPEGFPQAERAQLLRAVDCGYSTCLGRRCEYYKARCHFFSKRGEAASSHITIANHALVFSLYDPQSEDGDSIVSRAPVIVFDEAHNLESAITNQHTREVSDEMPVELGNRLLAVLQHEGLSRRLTLPAGSVGEEWREALARVQSTMPEVPGWVKLAAEIRGQVNSLLEQAADKARIPYDSPVQLTPGTVTQEQMQVMELLAKLAQRLLAVVSKYHELAGSLAGLFASESSDLYVDDDSFQMDLQSLCIDLRDCIEALGQWQPDDPSSICWFNCDLSLGEPSWAYKTAPLKAGPLFQPLLAGKECVVLSSATLTVADSFDYLQASLGFDDAAAERSRWLKLESPFNFQEQSLLLIATDMARPT